MGGIRVIRPAPRLNAPDILWVPPASRSHSQRKGRSSRRSVPVLVWVGLLASGCGSAAVTATSAPTASMAASQVAGSTSQQPSPSGSPAAAVAWTGPVRTVPADAGRVDPEGAIKSGSASDPPDATREYVDIEQVKVDSPSQPHWRIALRAAPPKAATLDTTQTVISYGLAFETTGDDVPDHLVGISTGASEAGGFRVWVTDLATGATEEQDGPPYGFPVEFAHPDEGNTGE